MELWNTSNTFDKNKKKWLISFHLKIHRIIQVNAQIPVRQPAFRLSETVAVHAGALALSPRDNRQAEAVNFFPICPLQKKSKEPKSGD